jgi:thiol-disulfide isomerase/thioredoxin
MATRDAAAANRSAAAARSSKDRSQNSRLPLILAAVVGLCLALALGISVALSDGGGDRIEDTAAPVSVAGAPLDAYLDGAQDLAVGQQFPTLNGTGLDGNPLSISGSDGPALIVYLAHWCHVCQSEVPVIADWLEQGGGADVQMRAVSTGFRPGTDNWPPSEWLEREGWEVPTLVDRTGSAAQASGQQSFPFFIAVDGDGTVVARVAGALAPEQLDELAALAAGDSAAAGSGS